MPEIQFAGHATGRPPLFPRASVMLASSTLFARHHSGESDYRGNLMRPRLGFPLMRVPAFLNPRVIRREPDKVLDRCRVQIVAACDRQQGFAAGDTLVNVPDGFGVNAIRLLRVAFSFVSQNAGSAP